MCVCVCIGGVSLTMRHRMQCSIVTDQSVTTKTEEECPLSPTIRTTFTLPSKMWDKKQKISTDMLVRDNVG